MPGNTEGEEKASGNTRLFILFLSHYKIQPTGPKVLPLAFTVTLGPFSPAASHLNFFSDITLSVSPQLCAPQLQAISQRGASLCPSLLLSLHVVGPGGRCWTGRLLGALLRKVTEKQQLGQASLYQAPMLPPAVLT